MRQVREAAVWGCVGWFAACSYYDLKSNAIPLAFGMTPDQVAAALKVPITPVSDGRGSQIYYAEMPWTLYFPPYERRMWLQFRGNRLTGWKNDWRRPGL